METTGIEPTTSWLQTRRSILRKPFDNKRLGFPLSLSPVSRNSEDFTWFSRNFQGFGATALKLTWGAGLQRARLCEQVAGIIVPSQILQVLCIARTRP